MTVIKNLLSPRRIPRGGGGTSLKEANGDVPLDRIFTTGFVDYNKVAFSVELLEWSRTLSDFWGKNILHVYGYLWLANVLECLHCW